MVNLIALTIGGSDSSGGAGIQADLKTFMGLKVHGSSVITCITSQNSLGVSRVDSLPQEAIISQIEAISKDIEVKAIKTGMLFNKEIIEATAYSLEKFKVSKIIDPVMISRTGAILLEKEAIQAYKKLLIPQAELITPNILEASVLCNKSINTPHEVEKAAKFLINSGARAVLIKGGGLNEIKGIDYFLNESNEGEWIKSKAIDTIHTNGSGCTLSAAITGYRAAGINLLESIKEAKNYVSKCLINPLLIGKGPGSLCHWN